MIHKLVDCNDPILKQKIPNFDFTNPPTDPIQLAKDLAETMIENNGLGLSANQIGLSFRAFAMKAEKIIVCFNPKIVDSSTETVILEEGCLSYPYLFVKIKRPKRIKVRYTEPNGNVVTRVFDGITSRCYQHELDHLDGIVYTKRANKYYLDLARNQARKYQKEVRSNAK